MDTMIRSTLTIAALCLYIGCSIGTNPVVSSDKTVSNGEITGTIINSSGIAQPHKQIVLYGTNFSAYTDSTGHYRFYNINEGEYELGFGDTSFRVSVHPGSITRIPPLVTKTITPRIEIETDNDSIIISEVRIFDSNRGRIIKAFRYGDYDEIIYTDAEGVEIQFLVSVLENTSDGYAYTLDETPVRIERNGERIYETTPPKGRVRTDPFFRSGRDTMSIYVENVLYRRFCIFDSSLYSESRPNYLFITSGATVLEKDRYFSDNLFVIMSADTFWINRKRHESIDWDIYFVDFATNDTCSYFNDRPDRGVQGYHLDDPVFSGNMYKYSRSVDNTERQLFEADCIEVESCASGSYGILVHFYDGPQDSTEAIPHITIGIGRSNKTGEIDKLYTIAPDESLKKGEWWYAGKIDLPAQRFDPREQRLLASSQ
jgi:hypothetical protein